MTNSKFGRVSSLALLLVLGAGCTETVPSAESEDIDLHAGASFTVEQTYLGFDAPSDEGYGTRTVTVDTWTPGDAAAISWALKTRQETAASQAAREAASKVPVGTERNVPDAVYEDVTTTGLLTTDALDNAARILLPSYWPEGAYDASGEENSLLWLSRAQYDELVSTSQSHVALGLFDSHVQSLLEFSDNVQRALAKLQGKVATDATTQEEITALTAESDWGDYVFTVNGEARMVRTIQAENRFADYVILANPENPLILKVRVKPLSLGFGMLSTLSVVKSLAGYEITSITY